MTREEIEKLARASRLDERQTVALERVAEALEKQARPPPDELTPIGFLLRNLAPGCVDDCAIVTSRPFHLARITLLPGSQVALVSLTLGDREFVTGEAIDMEFFENGHDPGFTWPLPVLKPGAPLRMRFYSRGMCSKDVHGAWLGTF